MNITKFTYKTSVSPNMSCGTGYSEPDIFQVECDDGSVHTISIDIWYCSKDEATRQFWKAMLMHFKNGFKNMSEAFEMYKKALRDTGRCPEYWK